MMPPGYRSQDQVIGQPIFFVAATLTPGELREIVMNIAFVTSSRIWGGVKTWMIEFGTGLMQRGDEVVFYGRDPRFVEEARRHGAEAHRINFGADYSPFAIRQFYRLFKESGIELACMNVQKELRCAGIAARMLGIPTVQRVGLPGDITGKFDQRMAQKYLVNEILVTSPWIERELPRRFWFIRSEKIHCVYNGKRALALPKLAKSAAPRFVITSRLAPGKGHGTVIEAFAQLRQAGYERFTCDIFGDGELRDSLACQLRASGLEKHLRLCGFSLELRDLLRGYDFAILASREEGMANTALEYLSAALPGVLSDGAITGIGLPGIITREQVFQFPYGNAEALAACLKSCLDMSDEQYCAQSGAAHRLALAQFDFDLRADELRAYFVEVRRIAHASSKPPQAA